MTWISKEHNAIFIHVPRTGGRSIQNALLTSRVTNDLHRFSWAPTGLRAKVNKALRVPGLQLVSKKPTLARLQGLERVLSGHIPMHLIAECITLDNRTSISWMVRNPFDWLVSVWAFSSKNESHSYARYRHALGSQFEDFFLNSIKASPTSAYVGSCNYREQFQTFPMKFEEMTKNHLKLAQQFGSDISIISKSNSSDRLNYRSYYDADLRNAVEKLFEQDLNEFDYEF